MRAKNSTGRMLMYFGFGIAILAFFYLNASGSFLEFGGGLSRYGFESYVDYEHGFPASFMTRSVYNRSTSSWKLWDWDQVEFHLLGIFCNVSILLIGIILVFGKPILARWRKFSLRSWLVALSTVCLVLGYLSILYRVSSVESAIIERLRDRGIEVEVSYYRYLGGSPEGPTRNPEWIKAIFGENILAHVDGISLDGKFENLDGFDLNRLGRLKSLTISSSNLIGIDAIEDLISLKELSVSFSGDSVLLKNLNFAPIAKLKLDKLSLACFDNLEDAFFLSNIVSLQELEVHYCEGLSSLDLKENRSLHTVYITNCENLVAITGLPKSLKNLMVIECPNLKTIDGLYELPNLKFINLSGCTSFSGSPELLDIRQFEYLNLGNGPISDGFGDGDGETGQVQHLLESCSVLGNKKG